MYVHGNVKSVMQPSMKRKSSLGIQDHSLIDDSCGRRSWKHFLFYFFINLDQLQVVNELHNFILGCALRGAAIHLRRVNTSTEHLEIINQVFLPPVGNTCVSFTHGKFSRMNWVSTKRRSPCNKKRRIIGLTSCIENLINRRQKNDIVAHWDPFPAWITGIHACTWSLNKHFKGHC